MKTRIPIVILTGTLALVTACNSGDEIDPQDEIDVGYDATQDTNQVADLPDSLDFAVVDRNGDGSIDPRELETWLETSVPRALGEAGGGSATDSTAASAADSVGTGETTFHLPPDWETALGLRLDEFAWQASAQYVYPRNREPGMFEDWDTNGDLHLGLREVLAGQAQPGEPVAVPDSVPTVNDLATLLFAVWDVDDDGRISPAEYRAGIRIWWM